MIAVPVSPPAPLRVLLIEDVLSDEKLIIHALGKTGRTVELLRVEDAASLQAALAAGHWDVILSDWTLPKFDGRAALTLVRELGLDVPFIVVSGTIGEETAVDLMRAGARDYVMKGRLERLLPAVERELIEREVRQARRRSETALRESEARYRRIVEATNQGVWKFDDEGRTLFVNPRMAALLGEQPDAMIGRTLFEFVPDEFRPLTEANVLRRQAGEPGPFEYRLRRRDGAEFWGLVDSAAIPSDDGASPVGVLALVTDITERKGAEDARHELTRKLAAQLEHSRAAEAELRVSEMRWARLWRSGLVGMTIADAAGRILEANNAFLTLVGRTPEELRTGTLYWAALTPPEWQAQNESIGQRLHDQGFAEPTEKEYFRRDGTRVPVLVGVAALGNGHFVSYITDLTERMRADAARRVAEKRYRRLFESGIVGVAIVELSGRIVEVNDEYVRVIGYSREELLSGEVTWLMRTPPESRERERSAVAELADKGIAHAWEQEYVRKDGSRVPVQMSVAMLEPPQVIAIVTDLTEVKRAEAALRSSEGQLRQSQKMDAIGSLAGGVAHDFNNLLSVILSYTALSIDELTAGSQMREDLEAVRSAAQRAAALSHQLLTFSRQRMMEARVVDLNEVMTGMDRFLRRLVGEDLEFLCLPALGLGHVRADPSQLEQVIMNLVVNARDAMPHGGQLTLETANVELDEAYAKDHLGVTAGPHVMLAVSDTGTGMDAATQARIFEPFFTTKEPGRGTGLGLSTVFGIVRQSGGSIWVYSEPGRGSTFKVYLPHIRGEVEPVRPPVATTTLRGTETVLLVEDEEALRIVARGILQRAGYTVLAARNGPEALKLVDDHSAEIHLLVSDVVMPLMSGPELAKRLIVLRPGLRVLCMSGYTDETVVRHGALAPGMAFLQKPITPDALTRKVREVLDAG